MDMSSKRQYTVGQSNALRQLVNGNSPYHHHFRKDRIEKPGAWWIQMANIALLGSVLRMFDFGLGLL